MTTTTPTPTAHAGRTQPAAITGRVTILAPKGASPHYRLTWLQPTGLPGGTTGGRILADALIKAAQIDASLARASGSLAVTTLKEVAADYLSTVVGRNHKTEEDWSLGHHKQTRDKLARCLYGFETQQAMAVDRPLLDRMRSQAGTRRTRKENTSALRGLLRWGATRGYFSVAQSELLPVNALDHVSTTVIGTAAPRRRRKGRSVGQAGHYIRQEDAPDAEQIVMLGEMLELLAPAWGRLAPEMAADCGLRWGEQFQLVADDVSWTNGTLAIRVDWQINPGARRSKGDDPRSLPKGGKTRITGVSSGTTVTGFRLEDALVARQAAARAEQAAGTNPEALLFPAPKGGLFHHSSFASNHFQHAALAADWPNEEWHEVASRRNKEGPGYVLLERDRVQFF